VLGRDAPHAKAAAFQHARTLGVVLALRGGVVHATVDLDAEPQLRAVQVELEAVNELLTAELQPEQPPIANEAPG
jgi:hypothetical protein